MKKKKYEKPTCKVIKIQQHKMLCSSPTQPESPWWGGEGG